MSLSLAQLIGEIIAENKVPSTIPSDIMYSLSTTKGMSGNHPYHIGTLLQALHRGSTMMDIYPEEKFYLHTVKFNPNVTIFPKVVDDDPEEGYDDDFNIRDVGETDVVIYDNAVEGMNYPEPLPRGCKTANQSPNYSIYTHSRNFKVVKVEELTTGWNGDDYNDKTNQHSRALYAACKLEYVPDVDENFKDSKIECNNCDWSWNKVDGGNDLYVCHKCGYDNTPSALESSNVNKVKYSNPNFDSEWEEAERYPEFVKIGKEEWINIANQGIPVTYSSIEDKLGNVDLDFDSLEEPKKKRFIHAFNKGTVEMSIAVKFSDNDYDLVAGNTRLAGLVKKGIDPKIWVVDISELSENFKDGKKKGKSRPGRVKKSGASCKGSVTDLRRKAKNASGEKAKMYHWCANMKGGKKK